MGTSNSALAWYQMCPSPQGACLGWDDTPSVVLTAGVALGFVLSLSCHLPLVTSSGRDHLLVCHSLHSPPSLPLHLGLLVGIVSVALSLFSLCPLLSSLIPPLRSWQRDVSVSHICHAFFYLQLQEPLIAYRIKPEPHVRACSLFRVWPLATFPDSLFP